MIKVLKFNKKKALEGYFGESHYIRYLHPTKTLFCHGSTVTNTKMDPYRVVHIE